MAGHSFEPAGKTVVVTGAASGIGFALAKALGEGGAAQIYITDLPGERLDQAAAELGATEITCDAGSEPQTRAMIEQVLDQAGHIDLFCANAGIMTIGDADLPDAEWTRMFEINVMSHVWATRYALPQMLERGSGHFLITSSAAGLLSAIGSAPYSMTKHAAIGYAEWLAYTYKDQGIGVTALCPQAVRTDMTKGFEDSPASIDGMIEPDHVARVAVETMAAGSFLALPHAQVSEYIVQKASNYDRWVGGMAKLQRMFNPDGTRK